MTRDKRIPCESGIYHVTARGVGQQVIFEDDADRKHFGQLMRRHLYEQGVVLHAWCFMQNHVHLLPCCSLDSLSLSMHQLLGNYAKYYNWRHKRTGHLFQERFSSKPVLDERQLLATIRYIHQNPCDLGVTDLAAYTWSSYREYVGKPFITDCAFALELYGGVEEFIRAHETLETDATLEPGYNKRARSARTDDAAIALAKELLGCESLAEITAADKAMRDSALLALKNSGLSVRQISRITGISKSVIQRI